MEVTQIQTLLKTKSKADNYIASAKLQESRLRLHSEVRMSREDASAALTFFLEGVKKILPRDKYRMFLMLLSFPVSTVALSDRIFTALEKIFDGRNPVIKHEFASAAHAEDYSYFRSVIRNMQMFWKTEGFDQMKYRISSVMIVDLPEVQTSDRPEPYMFFLPVDDIYRHDIVNADNSQLEYIMFKQGDILHVYCDEYYRTFDFEGDKIKGLPLTEHAHDIGFCPARYFWTTPVNSTNKVMKRSPQSPQLGQYDKLLFFDVSNDHLNLYARYPIYATFASDCDFQNKRAGHRCDGGYLRGRDNMYLLEGDDLMQLKPCPVCANKSLSGAGSIVEHDPPSKRNGNADLRNPVSITGIDRDSLDYNVEDIERRQFEIYSCITGFQGMSINNKAVNETQVLAILSSLESALKAPQWNFEQAIAWTDKTFCLLRYGRASYKSTSVSLGTEHFVMTAEQTLMLYKTAKEASFSTSTLDMLEDLYYSTTYRNNPEQMSRQIILTNLDPFRHLSADQVTKMYKAGDIHFAEYLIKLNFSSFIMRFEREILPVTEYGLNSSFDQRITGIKSHLIAYAEEAKPEDANTESESLKTRIELYGIAVRAGLVTPQTEDEVQFRQSIGAEQMSQQAVDAWAKDGGVRKPVTLQSQTIAEQVIETGQPGAAS